MNFVRRFASWVGWGGVLTDKSGQQLATPSQLTARPTSPDGALQISTVYACARLLAGTVSSLPLMLYKNDNGKRTVDRDSQLWLVLHEQPNDQMTPSDFWQAMIVQWCLRGNAFAQIMRDSTGEVVSLWPMSADQMTVYTNKGKVIYEYEKDGKTYRLGRNDVLHIKDIGTGLMGFSKLEFMSASVLEASQTQRYATANAENFGKPSGVLTVDHVIKKDYRDKLRNSLFDFKEGGAAKLAVLEADMKFQQISLTPEQSQLLETRKYGTEEICRWFGVPPVLIGATGATTWGSGIYEIVSGFHKFTLSPLLKSIEQSLMSRILTDEQRGKFTIEFNLDGLLRGDIQTRYQAYATAVQNGFKTRNEVRQLENDEPLEGGDVLTAQTNLAPLDKLGQIANPSQKDIKVTKQ